MGARDKNTKAVLSQGEPRDAAVNFNSIEFYNDTRYMRFPCHSTAFLLVFVYRLQPYCRLTSLLEQPP